MRQLILDDVRGLFVGYSDLVETLPDISLGRKLAERSNTIGAQPWFVVGGRESYARALTAGEWSGFSCSLTSEDIDVRGKVSDALSQAAIQFEDSIRAVEWTSDRDRLLLDILEHETQHQGQLIRYIYGLGYSFPPSWADRWSL